MAGKLCYRGAGIGAFAFQLDISGVAGKENDLSNVVGERHSITRNHKSVGVEGPGWGRAMEYR